MEPTKTIEELQNDLKQYSNLTQSQGQIRVNPGVIQRIHAFIQWSRDMIRTGLNPSFSEFPVEETARLLTNYKSHQAFIENRQRQFQTPQNLRSSRKMESGMIGTPPLLTFYVQSLVEMACP